MSATITPVPPAAADETAVPCFERDHVGTEDFGGSRSPPSSENTLSGSGTPVKPSLLGVARRTLGIVLLLVTVTLWTVSQFLASVRRQCSQVPYDTQLTCNRQTIFADNTYSKPYFVTYVNTSFFSISLVVILVGRLYASNESITKTWRGKKESSGYTPITSEEEPAVLKPDEYDEVLRGRISGSSRGLFGSQAAGSEALGPARPEGTEGALDVRETAKLSLEFCMLWVRQGLSDDEIKLTCAVVCGIATRQTAGDDTPLTM